MTYRVKRGKTEILEYYHVLAIFSKHYNKWFLHWDDEVLFEKGSTKFKILARMVVKDGNRIKEVDLEKDGQWGPKYVFSIRPMMQIESIEGELSSGFLSW